ncbi:MAG: 2-phosphosulfolactate phosphatase [Actinomycetota bacterium]
MPVTPDDHLAQSGHDVRVEWGPNGLRRLAPHCPTVVIVDVLSFTTCVDVALGRGATILPYRWHDGGEHDHAATHGATVAVRRDEVDADHPWSLSPAALADLPAGTRLVLPSPNGAALTFGAAEAGATTVIAACLRNASAVALHLASHDGPVGILPAGERWRGATGPLRPALEDLLGAGAIAAELAAAGRTASPEARAAAAVWNDGRADLPVLLGRSVTGRELSERGWAADVELAGMVDVSTVVAVLDGDTFVDTATRSR